MSLQQQTLKGIKWNTLSTFVNIGMQIGYTAVMSRLLGPAEFGLVTAAQVVLRFGSYFSEMGMGKALIQKAEITDRDIRSAFTVAGGLGLLFFLIFYVAIAPLVPKFILDDPNVVPVVQIMGLSFVFTGFTSTANNLLRRKLAFEALAKIDILSFIISYGFIGIGMAYAGYGVWSLVGATLSQNFCTGFFAYLVLRHPVMPLVSRAAWRPLLGYGSRMSLIGFLEFFSANIDSFIIGRLLGAKPLGIYGRAFLLVQLPVQNLVTSVSRVLFPALSSIQNDIDRLRRVYLMAERIVAFVILPLCMGLAVAAPEVVGTLLGPKWGEAIPIIRILAFVVPFKLLMNFAGIVCDATGRLNVKIAFESTYILVLAGIMYFFSRHYGLQGIAYTILAGEGVKMAAYSIFMSRVLHFRLVGDLLASFAPAILTALLVGIALFVTRRFLPQAILDMPLLALTIEGFAGAVGLAIGVMLPTSKAIREEILSRVRPGKVVIVG